MADSSVPSPKTRRVRVQVDSAEQARAIEIALADPASKASLVIVGILASLTPRAQRRVMSYIADRMAESEVATTATEPTAQ